EVHEREKKGQAIRSHRGTFLDLVKTYLLSGQCPLAHIKTEDDLRLEETLRRSAEASRANAEKMRAQLEALQAEKDVAFQLYRELIPVEKQYELCPPNAATRDNDDLYQRALRAAWEKHVWPKQRLGGDDWMEHVVPVI